MILVRDRLSGGAASVADLLLRHRRASRRRSWLAAHPATVFLVLVFTIGYPLLGLLILCWHRVLPGRPLLEQLPIGPDQVAALIVTGAALVPAAVAVTWICEGHAGVAQLARRAVDGRIGIRCWLLIVACVPVGTIVLAVCAGDTIAVVNGGTAVQEQISALLLNLVVVTLGEEVAWAGVLQSRLGQRHGVLAAGLLTAVPFALLHWPLALLTDTPTVGSAATALVFFVLLSLLLRPMLGFVFTATGSSVLAVAAQHAVFNRTTNADGVAATVLIGDTYQLTVILAVLAATVIWMAVVHRRPARPSTPTSGVSS